MMRYKLLLRILPVCFLFLMSSLLYATPEYSARTGQGCKTCHIEKQGGSLTERGLEYAASGYVWPPQGGYRVLGPIRKSVRFIIGLFHIVAAFLWFGTILYVHILLRPAYAAKGLPRGEVFLGMVSMMVVGITGVLLTISRIKSLDVLFHSSWGILLSLKILLYIIMVSSALFVVIFIGPRLKRVARKVLIPKGGIFDQLTLSGFDGKETKPALIAYKGKVYDVTHLIMWRNGMHMKHNAGADLTNFLHKAPHGEEKLESLKMVGTYDPTAKPQKTIHQTMFYVIAYMNLIIVFFVLFVISFWRWGI